MIEIARIELTSPLRFKLVCKRCGSETYLSIDAGNVLVENAEWGTHGTVDHLGVDVLIGALRGTKSAHAEVCN